MKIEHVAMYVKDLERTKTFFMTYFQAKSNDGYHNPNTGFRSFFLTFEDGARLEIMSHPSMISADKTQPKDGFSHIAFSVGSKEKVEQLTQKMREDGYQIISGPRTTGDGYYESCIIDMEGNQIEITV